MPCLARLFAALVAVSALIGVGQAQGALRYIVVTHGPEADPFWAAVKTGADRAAADAGVVVEYRAPAGFDLKTMASLVSAAIEEKPSGLIVSIPNAEILSAPIRAAIEAGIPVVTINSGYDVSASLGALLHVGQSEYEAGRVAGDAMRQLGGTKALCLNHELGNVALDLRCKGFIDGFAGTVEVLPVGPGARETAAAVAKRLEADPDVDVILALSASIGGEPAVSAVKDLGANRAVRVASFDVTDSILSSVVDGAAAFAIDQQPFLQGYLPVHYLSLLHTHGVIPVSNVSTGPRLVDATEAARRLAQPDPETPSGQAPATEQGTAEPSGG